MQFTLQGFVQKNGFRVFSFTGLGPDWIRIPFTVRINLDLARRYGLRPQEFPLICRGLLEKDDSLNAPRDLVFDEGQMSDRSTHESRDKPRRPYWKGSSSASAPTMSPKAAE